MNNNTLQGNGLALAALVTLLACQFFVIPAALPLMDNNEGLYATIAREMLTTRDLVVPRIEGLPYLEKPPLLYWMVATSFVVFGQNAWAARLVPQLAGALSCAVLLVAGRSRGSPRAGWIAACLLGSMVSFSAVAHAVMFDVVNALFVTSAVLCLGRYFEDGRRSWVRWGYGLIALSGLGKGLLGPAVFVLIGTVHWLREGARRETLRGLADPAALALAAAVFLPWHVALGIRSPQLLWHYVYDEHVLRFLDLREPHDYYTGPPWYYVPRVLTGILPWTLLLAYPIWTGPRSTPEGIRARFAATWFWTIFAFFTVSRAKANYYMVLGMPALAWGLAWKLDGEAIDRARWTLALGAVGTVLGALGAALAFAGIAGVWVPERYEPEVPTLVLAFVSFAFGCGISAATFRPAQPIPAVATASAGAAAFLVIALRALVPLEDELSSVRMGRFVRDTVPKSTQVLLYEDFERYSAFAFYAERRVGVLESRSNDLAAGLRIAGDPLWFPDHDALVARLTIEPPVIVVGRSHRAEFRARYGRAWRCVGPTLGKLTLYRTSCH